MISALQQLGYPQTTALYRHPEKTFRAAWKGKGTACVYGLLHRLLSHHVSDRYMAGPYEGVSRRRRIGLPHEKIRTFSNGSDFSNIRIPGGCDQSGGGAKTAPADRAVIPRSPVPGPSVRADVWCQSQ